MPDDKTIRGPQDGERIDINDPSEVRYWRKKFNCTEAKLRHAVATVGTSSSKVEKFLNK